MSELPYLGVLEVLGRDARKFLHAQLSAAIDTLGEGEATFACLCQLQGRVVALLLVCHTAEGFRLVGARDLLDGVQTRLSRYVLRDDVRLQRKNDLRVSGLKPGETPPPDAPAFAPLPGLRYAFAAGDSSGVDAFKAIELSRGVAWLDADSSEVYLPQMLGYEGIGALSFRKGCFPGQEIIARTRYLGRLKQRAVVVELDAATALPDETALELLGEGKAAEATLVDQARDAAGTLVGLVVVRAGEPFGVSGIAVSGARSPATGRWLEVSTKRAEPGSAPA